MDVGGALVTARRIVAGVDGADAVAALGIGLQLRKALEIHVERRVMGVALVQVTPGGIGLPDIEPGAGHRLAVAVEHPARHLDDLALGDAAAALNAGQIGIDILAMGDREERAKVHRTGGLQRRPRRRGKPGAEQQ